MNIFKLVFTVTVSIICASALAGNSIYKWKDKDGVVHYSQNAPIGQETEVITTKTPRSSLPEDTPVTDEISEKNTIGSNSNQEGTDKTDQSVPVATKDQATCDKTLKAIEDLQKPVVTLKGKVMTIEEKNVQLRNMDEIKKIHCP